MTSLLRKLPINSLLISASMGWYHKLKTRLDYWEKLLRNKIVYEQTRLSRNVESGNRFQLDFRGCRQRALEPLSNVAQELILQPFLGFCTRFTFLRKCPAISVLEGFYATSARIWKKPQFCFGLTKNNLLNDELIVEVPRNTSKLCSFCFRS